MTSAQTQWQRAEREAKAAAYKRVVDDFCTERNVTAVYEYRFHPRRRWRADVYLPDFGVIIEIDGGVWANGRHTRGQGYINDCEKLNEAALMGLHVLRFTTDMVTDGTMAEMLRRLSPF